MRKELIEMYQSAVQSSIDRTHKCEEINNEIQTKGSTVGELMDTVYAMQCLQKILEKERKVYSKLEKYLAHVLDGLSREKTVRTEWVTGTIKTDSYFPIPKEGTEEFDDMCDWLGLDPRLPVRISWERLKDYSEKQLSMGNNVPFDLAKVVKLVSVTCRAKRDLLEGFKEGEKS